NSEYIEIPRLTEQSKESKERKQNENTSLIEQQFHLLSMTSLYMGLTVLK
ncbi:hypothetical protein BgiBS90_026259, partial [Biomphalaria glabrata]